MIINHPQTQNPKLTLKLVKIFKLHKLNANILILADSKTLCLSFHAAIKHILVLNAMIIKKSIHIKQLNKESAQNALFCFQRMEFVQNA